MRIEGFTGVGKSATAAALRDLTGACVVSTDCFAREDTGQTYLASLDLQAAHAAAREALGSGGLVIFDGVCLEDVLPSEAFGPGFRLYQKRVSVPAKGASYWPEEDNLEPKPDRPNPLGVEEYHGRTLPHLKADLVVAVCLEDSGWARWHGHPRGA